MTCMRCSPKIATARCGIPARLSAIQLMAILESRPSLLDCHICAALNDIIIHLC